jgi:hypothetical protein
MKRFRQLLYRAYHQLTQKVAWNSNFLNYTAQSKEIV